METVKREVFRLQADSWDLRGTWNKSTDLASVICPVDPGHQRAGARLTELNVNFAKAALKNDFIWSWYSECLVRKDVAAALNSMGLTGLSTRPAVVTSGKQIYTDEYVEFFATGWGGIAAPESGVHLTYECSACGMLKYSGVKDWTKLVDWSQWDGSDIFMVWPLPSYIFTKFDTAQILKDSGLTGLELKPIEDLEPQDELSPGRMSYRFSPENLDRHNIPSSIR
ncbi:hypothetical protein [Granulicella mallensis]|uniref:Uncharacterized protein n=1 Tax=Granulicella mallensis (strain ATCC BAA-1857 / DSM 23137 / MP5ACTX8) TaxID=682795 RepID=G8NRR7_GRAMM|nr:hypothetical protein [Granulicella mallensis]AEU38508.1 hypothetical protein AciX8_4231 [Granulicella mallensis MP5ACTX8]